MKGAPRTAFHPGELWTDTSGRRIRAHGASVIFVAETQRYYWYGAHGYRQPNGTDFQHTLPNRRINVYSSKDLYNWSPHSSPAFVMPCGSLGRSSEGCYVDRPKVIPAAALNGYIMWLKATPFVAVATADSPLGPFRLLSRWRPGDQMAIGDIGTFVDPRSLHAYLIYSVKPSSPSERRVVRVSQMTNDRVNLSDAGRAASSSTIPFAREAPALFFDSAQHRYLAWTSRPSGWRANAAELFSTDDLLHGRWTSEGNPTRSSTSFNSQAACILPLPINSTQRSAGQRFLYVADRCVVLRPPCTSSSLPSPLLLTIASATCRFDPFINTSESGRYVWLPLTLEEGSSVRRAAAAVRWRGSWRLTDQRAWQGMGDAGHEVVDSR